MFYFFLCRHPPQAVHQWPWHRQEPPWLPPSSSIMMRPWQQTLLQSLPPAPVSQVNLIKISCLNWGHSLFVFFIEVNITFYITRIGNFLWFHVSLCLMMKSCTCLIFSDVSFVGGGTLVLEGTGFGASQPAGTTLVIGGEPATITSYTDTRVEATFPAQAAGNHAIKFTVGNNGYAAIS